MSTTDPLVIWPLEKWPELKESFKTRWPYSTYAYYLLDIQEKWRKKDYKNVKIYVPYGDINNGMVATCELTEVLYSVVVFSINENLTPMAEALVTTKNVDWSKRDGMLMKGVSPPLRNVLLEVFKKLDMKISWEYPVACIYKKMASVQQTTFEDNLLLHSVHKGEENKVRHVGVASFVFMTHDLSKSHLKTRCVNIAETPCPDEVLIVPLTKDHASTMNEIWPHKFPGSIKFFETVIEQNGGFGLLTKSGQELIAWVSQNEFGGLCHLYCVEEHRRKGYAQILARRQEYKIAQDGHDIHAFVLTDNDVARGLFAKMGYETYTTAIWIHIIKSENEGNMDLASFITR